MSHMQTARNELIVLGVLALLTALVAVVPWKKLILEYREYEVGKYAHSRAYKEERQGQPTPAEWGVKAEYSLQTGALRLHLDHRYIEPGPDLWVYAQFAPGEGGPPVAETFLRNHSGGVYSADNLRLPRGEWVMSLTGIQQLEFVFRREEILKVE